MKIKEIIKKLKEFHIGVKKEIIGIKLNTKDQHSQSTSTISHILQVSHNHMLIQDKPMSHQ